MYCEFLARRMGAKDAGIKKVADALKILLNGTFGKLGSMFSRMYAPDLLLGVTITGQLNLLCIIDELVKIKGVMVLSANTDGIMVKFPRTGRAKVEAVFAANSKRTGFEYEETPYRTVALRDVNNYIAIGIDGKVKGKGVHSDVDSKPEPLKTHRSFTICSKAALEFIRNGTPVEKTINECNDIRDFVSMANGDGQSGGLQTVRLGVCSTTGLKSNPRSGKTTSARSPSARTRSPTPRPRPSTTSSRPRPPAPNTVPATSWWKVKTRPRR